MNFMEKRKEQLGIKSLGDLIRSGKVKSRGLSENIVQGPEDFDCLANRWARSKVLSVIADSGVGKSEVVMYFFKHMLANNPESYAIYVSLEMTDEDIAKRWHVMTEDDPSLSDRLYIISRYDSEGVSRDININWIKKELVKYKEALGDIIAFTIDHIHIIGENDPSTLNSIMIKIKEMAVEMGALAIPMAQVNKSAGQKGEVPLDADAVLASSQLKYISDYIMQLHRPILRLEEEAKMSVLGWGYCKIREPHKNDKIKRGQNKLLLYDLEDRSFRKMNTGEFSNFKLWYNEILGMKSAEEKNKAFTYDLQKEITAPDGKKIIVVEKFSGSSDDL